MSGKMLGKASICYDAPVYIVNSASVVGTKEGQGPLGLLFDYVGDDDLFGAATWEEAESTLQKNAIYMALKKAGAEPEEIRYLCAGDLLGQSMASSFGVAGFQIPLLGLYGACSTCGEGLLVASELISAGFADLCVSVTSSHFASAEKEFRYPLEYGNQRPLSATWTVTGSGAFVLSDSAKRGARAKIMGVTVGTITDYGLKDSMNMGPCMAPAAASTIKMHLEDFERKPDYYDKIITGDLGSVGSKVLVELLEKEGIDISGRHMDCGVEIFDAATQDTHAGGSGCGCSAVTLSAYILKQIEERRWKKVLFLPTGALLSKTSFNEGMTVPGIAHGVVIESI